MLLYGTRQWNSLLWACCCTFLLLPVLTRAQPYPVKAALPDHARYYQLNLNAFNNFTNGVWSDVYQWDAGKESTDRAGNVIGGWKQLYQDNLVFDHYTEYGGYWEGFCISNRDYGYDTPDPLNQFTAATLGGINGQGSPYMIAYYGVEGNSGNNCRLWLNDGVACTVAGMYVTNTRYDHLSMTQGDGFARAFKQDDWFLLTAYGFDENGSRTGSASFYLADYRSSKAAAHYIITDWRWFDLSSLGKVARIEFMLSSSDNSVYGMNTPSYFCMDQLTLSLLSVQQHPVDRSVCKGDSAVFHIRVSGSDYYNNTLKGFYPRLQWRKNNIDIPGAEDTTLVIRNVQAADTGSYSCYVISDYYTAQYSQVFKDAAYRADDLSKAARLSLGSCTGGGSPVVVQPEGPLPWRLYPNPAYPGQEVTLKGYKNYTGRLFSLSGQLLRVFYINADTYRLPAPAVKGMYLLHCEQDHIYNYEKLLVQ